VRFDREGFLRVRRSQSRRDNLETRGQSQGVGGESESSCRSRCLAQFGDSSVAQRTQRCRGGPCVDVEMFGDQARRTRRDQATFAPLGIKGKVLENDPHLWAECAQ
jgi:hypothetical protein